MKSNICEQCGAPLESDVCGYCRTSYDIEVDYDIEDNLCEANITGIQNSVSEMFGIISVILVIAPIVALISMIKKWRS